MKSTTIDKFTGAAMAAPMVLGIGAFGLVPFLMVVWYSLHEWNPLAGTFDFSGVANYLRMFTDPQIPTSVGATLGFAGLLMVLNIPLAMLLANLLNTGLKGITAFRVIYFAPVVVSSVAWVVVWSYLLAANGGINAVLAAIGIDGPNWLMDRRTALPTVVVVQVIKGVGMNMILFLAALQGIPNELKEAAALDGASRRRVWQHVILPLMTPTILLVMILTMIGGLDTFVPVMVLTQGGPEGTTTVLPYLVYRTTFQDLEFGYGSALGVMMFVLVLGLTAIQWVARRKWVHDEV